MMNQGVQWLSRVIADHPRAIADHITKYKWYYIIPTIIIAFAVIACWLFFPRMPYHEVKKGDRNEIHVLYAYLRQIALGPGAIHNLKDSVNQRFILQVDYTVFNCTFNNLHCRYLVNSLILLTMMQLIIHLTLMHNDIQLLFLQI